jgi:DNA-directed RNA polymerase, subunit D (EC 2.7.7.6)
MSGQFDVQVIERDDRSARFVVRGLTPALANGLRRTMVADVPTFAIDTVQFTENSSVMFDEMIGLRLGLVPLTTPLDDFEIGDTVTVALDVEGPATAYSGDIESSDELVQPADENIPIVELKEGHSLKFEARCGVGKRQGARQTAGRRGCRLPPSPVGHRRRRHRRV